MIISEILLTQYTLLSIVLNNVCFTNGNMIIVSTMGENIFKIHNVLLSRLCHNVSHYSFLP